MSIRLKLPPNEAEWIGFAYSPLFEQALALHVMSDPKHHALQAAFVRKSQRLDVGLRRDQRKFAFAFRAFPPPFLQAGIPQGGLGFDESLQLVAEMDPELILSELLLVFSDGTQHAPGERLSIPRDPLLEAARHVDAPAATVLAHAFESPVTFRDDLVRFLERYWERAFHMEWAKIDVQLADDVDHSVRLLATSGAEPMLRDMVPEIVWDRKARVATLRRKHEHLLEIDRVGGITFVPSVFSWPHVRVYCDDPWPISFVYPIRALRQPRTVIPPERLLDALQSLADGTRLELLRLTAQRPRSTQELAVLLSLSEAAVSRNLRIMAMSGLLQSRREGRYVLYSCVKEALEALTPELIRLVEGGVAKSG